MTVPTIPDQGPILFVLPVAKIYKISSPSRILPLASINLTLSASPSRVTPKSARCSRTACRALSGLVDPQPSFML